MKQAIIQSNSETSAAVAHPIKRISIICNDIDYFLRHRRNVADELARCGHDVLVLAGGGPLDQEVPRRWSYEHVPVERFGLHPFRDAGLFWRTLKDIRQRDPDAIQLITLKPSVVAGLAVIASRFVAGRTRRLVVLLPGLGRLMTPGSQLSGFSSVISRKLVALILRLLARQDAASVVFETEFDQSSWIERAGLPREKTFLTNGAGVDSAIFHPPVTQREDGPLRVLFASRLLRSKGIDSFIEAASLTDPQQARFLVAGIAADNDPDAFPASQLTDNPHITFLGEITDMAALLRRVDVVCLPTRYGEGIPRILIEAAASGRPSIASNIDGCRQIVLDGENGVIVDCANNGDAARQIADSVMQYALEPDRLRQHGENALRRFELGGFDDRFVTRQVIDLLLGQTAGQPAVDP